MNKSTFFSVPVTKTNEPNFAGTLQLKITGSFDSKADSHSGMESFKPDQSGFDNSDLEESEDRNSSKFSTKVVGKSSSFKLTEPKENKQLSETNKLGGKNISGKGNKVFNLNSNF